MEHRNKKSDKLRIFSTSIIIIFLLGNLIFPVILLSFRTADVQVFSRSISNEKVSESNILVVDDGSDHRSTEKEIDLHFHRDGLLNTEVPTNPAALVNSFKTTQSISFSLSPLLKGDLHVTGHSFPNSTYGFLLTLFMQATNSGTNTMTVTVLDSGNSIAQATFRGADFDQQEFQVPFLASGAKSHTFSKGSNITITLNATVALNSGLRLRYDAPDQDSQIRMQCESVSSISASTYDKNDVQKTKFEPNPPQSDRIIKIRGEVRDKIADYDVNSVTVKILSPTDALLATLYANIVSDNDDTAQFNTTWEYNKGMAAGIYRVQINVRDNSGNNFTQESSFSMSETGVLLDADVMSNSGVPGNSVAYVVQVLNSGGKTDTIKLTHSINPSSWTVTYSKDQISLSAGASEVVTVSVFIPSSALEGDFSTLVVTGTSQSDSNSYYSLPEITTTVLSEYDYLLTPPSSTEKEVPNSGSATYSFSLQNTGQGNDTYTISILEEPGPDWDAMITGAKIIQAPTSGSTPFAIYSIYLGENEIGSLNFIVSAPDNPGSINSETTLTVSITAFNASGNEKSFTTTTSTEFSGTESMGLNTDGETTQTSVKDSSVHSSVQYEKLIYSYSIENFGYSDWNVTISVNAPTGWVLDLGNNEIQVKVNQEKSGHFEVTPTDGNVTVDELSTIVLTATVDGKSSLSQSLKYYARVQQFYDMDFVLIDGAVVNLKDSSEVAEYRFRITNTGNGKDTFTIEPEGTEDWKFQFLSSGSAESIGSKLELTLEAGQFKVCTLRIIPDEDAQKDDSRDVKIIITNSENERVGNAVTLTATVENTVVLGFVETIQEIFLEVILFVAVLCAFFYAFYKIRK